MLSQTVLSHISQWNAFVWIHHNNYYYTNIHQQVYSVLIFISVPVAGVTD